jgi:sirohydrochlorin cobaltochelatase
LKIARDEAVVLFAHGARDARWAAPLATLAEAIQALAARASVRTAFLELQTPTLLVALEAAASEGVQRIHVVPVFWAAAGHVEHELPPILAEFSGRHPRIVVRTLPVLSELPGMLEFIARAIAEALTSGPISGLGPEKARARERGG